MNVKIMDFLLSFFIPEEDVNLRVFSDRKENGFPGANISCKCCNFHDVEDILKQHNSMNRGVFFVVNYGGNNDESITRVNAQFFEMDAGTFAEQLEKIKNFLLKPSIIVQTRKSLHTYYLMDGTADVKRFRTIQKQLDGLKLANANRQ